MLRCSGLSKSFEKELFLNFNLELEAGEILAITGPSGCGKTTLLRCICGLEKPDSGDIFVNDINIANKEVEERGIGMIFQKPVLFPHLSVEGNLRLGDKNGDIESSLKEVGLANFELRDVASLSGGEGQRLSLIHI